MYRGLVTTGTLNEHIQETGTEAQALYEATVERLKTTQEMGDEAKFAATEIVFDQMIQFQTN